MNHDQELLLITRILWHYYREGLTQGDIAYRLGVTRAKVNKILGEAKGQGLVHIQIDSPVRACVELEAQLRAQYNLYEVVVTPSLITQVDLRRIVGMAAADYLNTHLKEKQALGVTGGKTIYFVAQALRQRHNSNNTVVSLCGGLARKSSVNPYEIATMVADRLDAKCFYITAPHFVKSPHLKKVFLESDSVQQVFDRINDMEIALLSPLDLSEESEFIKYKVLSTDFCQDLRKQGTVGEICGQYLDLEGNPVNHPICDQVIAPTMEQLKAIPKLVLAAGGKDKVPIIKASIKAGLCHVLVTDELTAQLLVQS
ncbi:sugar-binding transcriptional regulator [Dethiosulfatarculus sandiegensis]|uniref:Sugar-binding domain-containing protein n=1 Tax=Dethiosulfatarculus sandiegensis TaxID=1429043 RepID=A0A0D2GKF0_9BACT|nr:sugar-binding transcriptional regulator [Dethiosulfatarculus sandiegensis]KIX15242.1 hypothetical protein X474_05460 [Dethiosulfatarculus sandiegensis]